MAQDITRTAADDIADALAALDSAEQELARWVVHLERVAEHGVPVALQASHSADIVHALITEARCHTRGAVRRADLPPDALPA